MTTNLDYLEQGSEISEQTLDVGGYRRVQHMNESIVHRGSVIERGGYAIRDENDDAPDIGKRESIKHRGGNSTIMRVAQTLEVALIGFSPRYYVSEYEDPAEPAKRVTLITNAYVSELPTKGRCRSAISLFVVLKVDEERRLWELAFKGYNTSEGFRIINQSKGLARKAAESLSIKLLHTFALWLPLGVGESHLVGKVEQSPVTPPMWKLTEDEDLTQRLVGPDDFARFIELRRELDEFLATGRYNGQPLAQLPAAMPAPVSTNGVVTF